MDLAVSQLSVKYVFRKIESRAWKSWCMEYQSKNMNQHILPFSSTSEELWFPNLYSVISH